MIYDQPEYGCVTRLSGMHMRHKAADVSTWTNTQLQTKRTPAQVKIDTGLSWGVKYEVQVRASNSHGGGPWSAVSTATPTAAYTLAETGVEDRDQTWTVYLCGGGECARHGDLDTAEDYASFLNTELTPRLSEITAGEYEPTFVAATGEMPTGKHTGGYSLYYACKAESGQHIVFGHHADIGYGGAAVICPPAGWLYAFVNQPTVPPLPRPESHLDRFRTRDRPHPRLTSLPELARPLGVHAQRLLQRSPRPGHQVAVVRCRLGRRGAGRTTGTCARSSPETVMS